MDLFCLNFLNALFNVFKLLIFCIHPEKKRQLEPPAWYFENKKGKRLEKLREGQMRKDREDRVVQREAREFELREREMELNFNMKSLQTLII